MVGLSDKKCSRNALHACLRTVIHWHLSRQLLLARMVKHNVFNVLNSIKKLCIRSAGKKRKISQGQHQQVIGQISNKKIKADGNGFADDEQAPWANFQPL